MMHINYASTHKYLDRVFRRRGRRPTSWLLAARLTAGEREGSYLVVKYAGISSTAQTDKCTQADELGC